MARVDGGCSRSSTGTNALPLPEAPYEMGIWKRPVRLGIDYHLEIDGNFYSAPFALKGRILAVKLSEHLVVRQPKG